MIQSQDVPSTIDPAGPVRVWPALRVDECFELLADKQPDAPAILVDSGTVNYADLDRTANRLANTLLASGLENEEAVGVLTGRSASLPAAFLAILKAGGAYVPMGFDLPAQRLASMAAQSDMRRLIVLDELEPPAELLAALHENGGAIFRPGEEADVRRPNRKGKTSDLVAILFTSGSTGQPKGVMLQHDACVNMAYGHIEAQRIDCDDRVLLATAPGFILGFRELCVPMLAGAAYVPATRTLLDDPAGLLAAMSRHRVTVAMFTPSYLRLFDQAIPEGLRCLLTAGERPNAADARAYARHIEYWNIHGATEVCGTICMTRVGPDGSGALPSGRPFINTAVHLLDRDGCEVPPGETGEIHVVGTGVARGYLNQPHLTAEHFVETAFGRAYRSNDLGRWNNSGDLESVGRANDVVKVSGQSVSLGEVEQTLMRHDMVRLAAAVQHEGRMIAFVESDAQADSLEYWHGFLGKTLPGYMLPSQVTAVPRLPLTNHGKVDRQSLLALATAVRKAQAPDAAYPQGESEQRIAQVWEEILGVKNILREDNFFALGGTSLLSIAVGQRLQALGYAATAQSVLLAGTIAALADRIGAATVPAAVPTAEQGVATVGQKDFWIASKLGLETPGSQITRILAVRGTVPKLERWQSAWTQLVERHAALRTAFLTDESDNVLWRTAATDELGSATQISIDHCETPAAARECIVARAHLPFDLTQPLLARGGLVQLPAETLFWFTLHHAAVDGFSARILQEDLYALLTEQRLPPAVNGIAAADRAERHYLNSGDAERDHAWWQQKLDALPGDAFHPFASDRGSTGAASAPVIERLDHATLNALARLARKYEVGLHALLLTLLAAEARRRDGRSSVVLGSGISLRPPGADAAVGYFVNLLPLILEGNRATPIAEQMRAAQRALTETVEHGAYPASLIYREFRQRRPGARPQSRNSLFDISLTTNPSRACGDERFSLSPRRLPGERAYPAAGLHLAFSHEPVEDGLELALVFNADFFDRSTAQAWLGGFAAWARWLAEDLDRAEAPLPALLPEEAQRLAQWERGPVRTRPAARFHELVQQTIDRYPDRPAVVTATGVQTYADLESRSNRVARALLAHGIAREEPVAVLTECCADLPATVLGIWKAGACYLPLALDQPPERLAFMATDAGATALIVLDGHSATPVLANSVKTVLRPEDWAAFPSERVPVAGTPRDLAFIIYTSGTSGMPKGVLIQHDSLINAASISGEAFGVTPDDRFALVATPGFDASLWELSCALLHGMAVVPVSQALRDDPWALKQWYKTHGVTMAFHSPSYLRISQDTPFDGLRILLTGGEAPNHDDQRCYAGQLAFWNAYGPTETCIFVCAERLSREPDETRPLPVGRPLANTGISIRRDDSRPTPPGVLGEVWLSGAGLARGYLNNPELTAQRFVETCEGRFYRTGDLGRWTEEGLLELAGRIDQQVKLHGQRVELGEIEQALRSHEAVAEAVAVVDASANGTKTLRAFVRPRPSGDLPADDEWRDYLGQQLPVYMIPASVTSVAAIPLTSAGKTDWRALLQLVQDHHAVRSAPVGEIEIRIASVWGDLFGVKVSREDNFFGLGGNSLLAVTLAHRLSRDLDLSVPARELFAEPTLSGFARRVAALTRSGAPVQQAAATSLATEGQREFYVAERAGLDTRTFTIPVMRLIDGEMPPLDRWNNAWAVLVDRHESLRTFFQEDPEGRLHTTTATVATQLESATLADLTAARAFVRQRQAEPFCMGQAPLWRAGLVHVSESGEHLFWLALHHSLGDGRSIGILLAELGALLSGAELPAVTARFAESAMREQAYLAGPECVEDERYWRELLKQQSDSAFEEGPLDFARSAAKEPGTHRLETRLDRATAAGLQALAQQHEASLHAVMLTLLALETRRRTGREDIVLGTTASIRETASESQVVGYYVNMLPVPCHAPGDRAFGAALQQTQQSLREGLQHARYPFARIYQDFRAERPGQRDPARYPLFDLAVTENPGGSGSQLIRVPASLPYERTGSSPGQDMVLIHQRLSDGGLLLQWHVNAAVYTQETAQCWLDGISGWAEWLAQDLNRAGEPLPALLPREVQSLERWQHGDRAARPASRFHELFERVADRHGDNPAVITRAGCTTYADLDRDANVIAHSLPPGIVVGVLTERSPNLPAAVLGIWKAGAVYLPLAADLPADRLDFLARDAGAAHLIALDGVPVPPVLADLPLLRPELIAREFRQAHTHRPQRAGSPDDAAYIIHTSGSTGQPKGTLIGHDAYVNTVLGAGETIGLTADDRSLMFSSPSFDVSLSDIGLPLAFGAAMCPVPFDVLSSPSEFRALLADLHVTVADVTPTYLRLFDGDLPPSVRTIVTGGEAPLPAAVETWAPRVNYFNAYGPTENTITCTMAKLSQGHISGGRPLPNTSVHICDPRGNPLPPGVSGEIWLGGAGLGRGYVGRPELTSAAFIEAPSGRRYRSGDVGRWRADGELAILGRIDDQVKLNGIRVELGEVEHALGSHPDIAQAVALVDVSLWGFVCPLPGRPSPTDEMWRTFLAGRLPSYMIPSAVVAVPSIPVNNSGKVDKSALKSLLKGRAVEGKDVPPTDGLEARIAAVWSEVLGHTPIYRDDNFFALGGHSLLAIAAAHRLEESLGRPVPARELFAEPTLRGFARRISASARIEDDSRSDRATEGQCEFWIAEHAGQDARSFNIPLSQIVCGHVPPEAEWRTAWATLVARHDALRTSFHEDSEGTLRRSVPCACECCLEITVHPDMPATLAHVRDRQTQPFVMAHPPLWRAGLAYAEDSAQPVFWLVLHHAIGDGVSMCVLLEELKTLLQGGTLPPAEWSFDSSAGREERYLAGPDCHEDALYWQSTLAALGDGALDEWTLDFPRPLARTRQNARGAHRFRVDLDASTANGLRDLARKNGASLHALMLTIMAHEVSRRTGRPEFLLGTAASIRESAREARVVGYYVNALPVTCRVAAGEPVEQAVETMQRTLADALHHGRYPFARIYRDFREAHGVKLHPARSPLYDLVVSETPGDADTEGLLRFASTGPQSYYELSPQAPAQDMLLAHEGQPDGSLVLRWFVNAALYEKETAAGWIESLAAWARYLSAGNRRPDAAMPALLPHEEKLLATYEPGPVLPHIASELASVFEHWARIQPDRPALVTEEGTRSYANLNACSNALAYALLAEGVARQAAVGVLTDRSTALPETVLGIWKAGACYLPLFKDLPEERLAFIAHDAGMRLLLVLDGHDVPAPLAHYRIVRPENLRPAAETPLPQAAGEDAALVIYTSGSTGVPKGVMLHHLGLTNLGVGGDAALGVSPDDRVLQMSSPAFDAWISDLAIAWAAGAAVVPVLRHEMEDIAAMGEKLARLGVTVATMSPSYLGLFEQADLPGLRVLMTVGEPPHRADALYYASRLRYFNGYGPTENSAATSMGQVAPHANRFTAGRPITNVSVHILDKQGTPVPPGAVGLIWLGGIGLALGYLNRPGLTAASFIETPAGRRYCTGDLGRWTHTGELEILGRSDGQVKLHGQRIELGEIEHRLAEHPATQQAAAIVETHADGAQRLWAFACLLSGAAEPTQAEWHDHLSKTLPTYMVPWAVIRVPAIPMNTSGKVDREALLRALPTIAVGDTGRSEPQGAMERCIAELWAEHLETPSIAREDNFFDLGGNSLRAISVVNQLRRTVHCNVNDLYEHPRLADFAATCRQRPEHLRSLIQSSASHWHDYQRNLASYEAERDAALAESLRAYATRNQSHLETNLTVARNHRNVLLTGATGYLGAYLLRELMSDPSRHVRVVVRAADERAARTRLGDALCHYFGVEAGRMMRDDPRLAVFAGDLRQELSSRDCECLSNELNAIFHCAANVKHFGPYEEFHADNVAATERLLRLAEHNAADFHFISTISTCGKASEDGFRLFTEYDLPPEALDQNYYVRTKQEAERLVVAAREYLPNACIYRVGNVVFAADGGPLQLNVEQNAFFRQIAAFVRLGAVPDDSHVWLCHVDVVARALVLLAGATSLANETHHIENARRDPVADFVSTVPRVPFDAFLEVLERATADPSLDKPLTETLENFGIYSGRAPQPQARRLEIVSDRTQALLNRMGLVWPSIPDHGRAEMLRRAADLY